MRERERPSYFLGKEIETGDSSYHRRSQVSIFFYKENREEEYYNLIRGGLAASSSSSSWFVVLHMAKHEVRDLMVDAFVQPDKT